MFDDVDDLPIARAMRTPIGARNEIASRRDTKAKMFGQMYGMNPNAEEMKTKRPALEVKSVSDENGRIQHTVLLREVAIQLSSDVSDQNPIVRETSTKVEIRRALTIHVEEAVAALQVDVLDVGENVVSDGYIFEDGSTAASRPPRWSDRSRDMVCAQLAFPYHDIEIGEVDMMFNCRETRFEELSKETGRFSEWRRPTLTFASWEAVGDLVMTLTLAKKSLGDIAIQRVTHRELGL